MYADHLTTMSEIFDTNNNNNSFSGETRKDEWAHLMPGTPRFPDDQVRLYGHHLATRLFI